MNRVYDLSELSWTVTGFTPTSWRMARSLELGFLATREVAPVPAAVPGSVQQALRQAGLLPDWNRGLDFRACEWVENRDWCFATVGPVRTATAPKIWLARTASTQTMAGNWSTDARSSTN